jgi:hypothetical protein
VSNAVEGPAVAVALAFAVARPPPHQTTIVISTEATHRLIVSRAVEKPASLPRLSHRLKALALAGSGQVCAPLHALQLLRVTPAMEAGISGHVWSIEELVGLLEA